MTISVIRNGILWTGIEKVLVNGVSFLQGVWLARLLGPEDFGLAAMLGLFLSLGVVFSESGLASALVVCLPSGTGPGKVAGVERIAWRWNLGAACVIYLLLVCASPVVADWYRQPILMPLMTVMALNIVLNAVSVVAVARLTRAYSFGRLASINGVCSVVSATVALVLAYTGCGVWSIAGMGLVGTGLKAFMVRLACGRCEKTEPESVSRSEFRRLLCYGLKLMTSGAIHVLYLESYNLIVGKKWSPTMVGLFARGQRWARLPGEVVNESVCRVALPQVANGPMRDALRIGLVNALLLLPGLLVLAVWAEEIVAFALGPKWLDCVPYLRLIIVGQFFTPISGVALLTLRAKGCAGEILKTDMIKKPLGFAALGAGIPFGVIGLCWASVANDVVEAVVDSFFVWRCWKTGGLGLNPVAKGAASSAGKAA